jgi:hypothetical protein
LNTPSNDEYGEAMCELNDADDLDSDAYDELIGAKMKMTTMVQQSSDNEKTKTETS